MARKTAKITIRSYSGRATEARVDLTKDIKLMNVVNVSGDVVLYILYADNTCVKLDTDERVIISLYEGLCTIDHDFAKALKAISSAKTTDETFINLRNLGFPLFDCKNID